MISSQQLKLISLTLLLQSSINPALTDRQRTCPLTGVITGSQGGAAPGTSWHTAHLDDFFFLHCKKKSRVSFNGLQHASSQHGCRRRTTGVHIIWNLCFLLKLKGYPPVTLNILVSCLTACLFDSDSPANCLSRADDQDGRPALWITLSHKRGDGGRKSKEK